MDTKLLKQKILDLAIRGKLVPQDPNDEPASVLLERIRAEKEQLVQQGKIKKPKTTAASDTQHYENIPFDIPQSWEWVRLGDVCAIKGGKRIPKGMSFSKVPTDHIYIRVSDMKNNTIVSDDLKYIDDNIFEYIKNYTIADTDLYVTIAGTIGAIGQVPHMFNNMNLTENAVKLTNIQVDKLYLMYALSSATPQAHFTSKYHQTAQPKLSIETLSATFLSLPPLAEQKRIVAEIERWFAVIDDLEVNKQDLQAAIKQTRAKVLDLAIHGKLVPQDPNDEPAIELLKRINPHYTPCDTSHYENLPFDIPQSWEWVTIGNISQLITKGTTPRGGNAAYVDSGIGFLRAENVVGYNKLNLTNLKFITEDLHNSVLSRSQLKKNDLLITIAGTLGRTATVTEDVLPLNANQAVSIVRLIDDRFLNYIVYSLNSPIIQSRYTSAKKVTAIPNLTLEIIRDTFLPLPPLAEQKRITRYIEKIFNVLDTISAEL